MVVTYVSDLFNNINYFLFKISDSEQTIYKQKEYYRFKKINIIILVPARGHATTLKVKKKINKNKLLPIYCFNLLRSPTKIQPVSKIKKTGKVG